MKIITIPTQFILKDTHLEPAIKTLYELIKTKRGKLALDFSQIQEMGKGDFMVLLAQIEKSILTNRNSLFRKGKLPVSKHIKTMLVSADNMFHVNQPMTIGAIGELNDSERQKLLNPSLVDNIVKDLRKIGIKEYYFPFNVFLTELIGNAVEHGIENKNINWWLSHEIDRKNKIVKYTFVDMGLGIIKSHKKAGLPFKYKFLKNHRIVLDALYGKLGSSTKKSYRGRGLPQLREMIENEFISDLNLITNDITLNFHEGHFNVNKNPNFVGTYYCWTIDQNNYHKWKNTQFT